ncbi:MAG: PASTA domain-containing protein, partial [Leptolyngbyaceae cyanobacterium SM1_1_3]|nr:PASTA domain-containing protein [Leptolyngbyaceae cyanobacterium SM1_1_3]
MALNLFNFVIGTTLAKRQGVTDPSAQTRVALIGGMLGSSVTGLVMTTVLAQREAASESTTAPPPEATTLVEVPDVTGLAIAAATQRLEDRGLRVQPQDVVTDRPQGQVLKQVPEAGAFVADEPASSCRLAWGAAVPNETGLPNVI